MATGAYTGNPNIARQGARARQIAQARNVSDIADPRTYGFMQGLLTGSTAGELGYSVFDDPETKRAAEKAAEVGFIGGGLLQAIPVLGPALKGYGRLAAGQVNRAMMGEGGLLGPITPQPMYVVPPGKAPRMSAAEARAAGYWHDIGAGKKLPIPISEMTARLEPVGNLPPKIAVSPEKMKGGAIVSLAGDRSATGQNLLGIGDTQFETPVYLGGGYDFMRANSPSGSIWAAEKGSAQGLLNQINEAANVGKGDVFGVYTSMGPLSMNYNTMMADSLFEQIKAGKISKKNIAAFDREVASIRPEWKGIMNAESRNQLEENGALRHAFVDRMQLDKFQNAGFPNIAYTRYAITDPLLLNEPMYSGGLAVGKMKPNTELITNPVSPHKTYNTQLAGEYVGGLERSVPKEIMFPDWYKMRREIGAPESGDVRSFQLANPIQPTNQEWLDSVMQYLSNQKSLLD